MARASRHHRPLHPRDQRANREEMWSETILAVADILAAREDWRDAGGALLDAFDAIPLRSLKGERCGAATVAGAAYTARADLSPSGAAMAIREAA